MKHQLRTLGVASILVLGITSTFAVPAYGEADVITDDQIKVIRSRCTELKATLQQLHDSDKLLRINRGDLYQVLSDELMSPLNQRIASNQLDGANLVRITANYTTAYQQFYTAYQSYENSLTALLAINCVNQPTTFYSQLLDAHEKRINLHETSVKLVTLAKDYKTNFTAFKKSALKNTGAGE